MKHIHFICTLFAATLLVASGGCGNAGSGKGSGGTSAKSATSDTKSDGSKKEYLAADVLVKMDSLVAEMGRLGTLPIIDKLESGEFVLTEKEKMIKPDYLLPVSEVNALGTLRQKYCGVMVYGIDMKVAGLYAMPTLSDYRQSVSKLLVDIDNNALSDLLSGENDESKTTYKDAIRNIYDEELSKGSVNLFWNLMVASSVESLYVITQNIDKFIVCFDDRTATEVTKRISKFREAVEELIPYHPEMQELYTILEPLYTLDAHNVASLTSGLYRLKNDISRIRTTILRD